MKTQRHRLRHLITLLLCAATIPAETLRGPLNDSLIITPGSGAATDSAALETITLVELDGDERFYDAIEIELTSPLVVSEFPGALTLHILGPTSIETENEVATVVGPELLMQPLVRGGKTFYEVIVREDAKPAASPAVTRIEDTVPPGGFPIAIAVSTRMKGLSQEVQASTFGISVRPVAREIGAIAVSYPLEDGTSFDPDGALAPEFTLFLDGSRTPARGEYLLAPGLHRLQLVSERYQDAEVTVGVERGRTTLVELPLNLALATVSFAAPRGANVFVNGEAVPGSTGDFTVPPGDHTIVVVVGDYSLTRRFTVSEEREYSIAVTMDIAVEEIK